MSIFDDIKNYQTPIQWKYIILHHSLSKDGQNNDWEAIRNWHMGRSGSADVNSPDFNKYILTPDLDIGYNYGLEIVDGKYTYQVGRPLTMVGAHCIGRNRDGIGICVVGDYDIQEPTHQQYFMVACLCRELMRKFNIPIENVQPHWMYADKTCPGKMFDILKQKSYIQGVNTDCVA